MLTRSPRAASSPRLPPTKIRGVDDRRASAHAASQQADLAGPVLTARVWATRHLEAHGRIDLIPLVEGAGELEGLTLGVDQAEVAVLGPRAGNDGPHPGRRVGAERLEERLPEERAEAGLAHMRNEHVLLHREPEFALAVEARQASELDELIARDPPDRDQAADDASSRLFLPGHTDVVAAAAPRRRLARPRQGPLDALDDGLAKALHPPLLEEHLQA